MEELTREGQLAYIFDHFPELNEQQKARFEAMGSLYEEWNEKINVVSRKDIANLYLKHILHSLALAKIIHFKPKTRILDIGCGGGFPGIPLAVMFPEAHFHLVDSVGKKIGVVEAVTESLSLPNVSAAHMRAEKIKNKYDFVTVRAVAPLHKLYHWTRQNVKAASHNTLKNGLFCLKGGDLQEEILQSGLPAHTYPINTYFSDPYFKEKYVLHIPLS